MKNAIVITTIFEPTETIKKFAEYTDYELIVVGDRKTPVLWDYKNVKFLSIEKQLSLGFKLSEVLPYNHYCRKMLGYLYAIKNGTDSIIDTDDDNIPKDNWSFPAFSGEFYCLPPNLGFVNIYQLFTSQHVWPRGLPLDLITTDFDLENKLSMHECKVGVWQGLADDDPDVDAIYCLTSNKPCTFNEREPVILSKGTIAPFNTQNTIIRKELIPLMYLPTSVTFRFTDILRGLIAQPIMNLYGFQLGFMNATVIQKRNPHDYTDDFISEIPMYQSVKLVIESINKIISVDRNISDNLYNSYQVLFDKKIVLKSEMETLEAWLEDISNF